MHSSPMPERRAEKMSGTEGREQGGWGREGEGEEGGGGGGGRAGERRGVARGHAARSDGRRGRVIV